MKAGWPIWSLGDVCDVVGGGTPSKDVDAYYGGSIPWATVRDLRQDVVTETEFSITQQAVENSSTNIIPAGNVVIATRVGLGKVSLLGQDTAINQDLRGVIPKSNNLSVRYLYWWLKSISHRIVEEGTGATVQGVKLPFIKALPIPVPSIEEQHRIVAILDEAFESISKAKANAEKNLKNAKDLFESYLQSVFQDAWNLGDLVTLADMATDITDGDHMPPPKSKDGIPFITIGNVLKDLRIIDFSNTFMVPSEYFDGLKSNKKPKVGDVLYTVTGSFGIPVLVNEERDFCFQRHIGLVRPKEEFLSEWLFYLLMSPQVFRQANAGATGAAQKTVSLKVLRGFVVPRVPIAIQEMETAKLKCLANETKRLESIYKQQLDALYNFKQSLLHKAFSGTL